MKFLPKGVKKLFKKLFPISSKLLSNFFEDFQICFQFLFKCYPGYSNVYISVKFLSGFPKIIAKFFRIPKFH